MKKLCILALLSAFLALPACGPVQRLARRSARCELHVGPPHRVACYVDGELAYEQMGPHALSLEGCCRCPAVSP